MAWNVSTERGIVLGFRSDKLEPHELLVVSVAGHEAISSPYSFEFDLVSPRNDLELDDVLRSPASFTVKQGVPIEGRTSRGVHSLTVPGVLSSLEWRGHQAPWTIYRAVLVPRLWCLSLRHRSQVFVDKTVPEIVKGVLKENGLGSDDVEFKLTDREYPKRPFVMQYRESDLNFLSRLLEHEGIFYYFAFPTDRAGREKMVIADDPALFEPLPGEIDIPYRHGPAGRASGSSSPGSTWYDPESVTGLEFRMRPVPAEVVLRDYNPETPTADLTVTKPVSSSGHGRRYLHGERFASMDEGRALAKVRAEELRCREGTYSGSGDVRSFRAGHTFRLTEHPDAARNQGYLLLEVWHKGVQDLTADTLVTSAGYENQFSAIPADGPFRPERSAIRPSVSGTLTARVDAAGNGEYSEPDEHGRYKVKFLLDLSSQAEGNASCWIRLAEPYAGDCGMHFPLHKGTEVAIAFHNGDPDLPYIGGALPNPATPSPVTASNYHQSVIRTKGGNRIVLDDLRDCHRVTISTPGETSYINLGARHDAYNPPASPPGITMGTQHGIGIYAGGGIALAANAPNHENGTNNGQTAIKAVHGAVNAVSAATSIAGGFATDTLARVLAFGGEIGGTVASIAGGISDQGCYISAPTNSVLIGMSGALVGSAGSATLAAGGAANVFGVLGACVAGAVAASVVAGVALDVVSVAGNVKVQAQLRGDVTVEAKKTVHVLAKTKDYILSAKENVRMSNEGKLFHVVAKQDLVLKTSDWPTVYAVDPEKKKLLIQAGTPEKTSILLEDDKLTIQAETIVLQTPDGKKQIAIGKGADPYGISVKTEDGGMGFETKPKLEIDADANLAMKAKKITITANTLNEKGADKIERANSEEG